MEQQATYDDAKLILQLYEMRREARLREARRWFGGDFYCQTMDEFAALCPPNSEENASFRMVTSYWAMVASFITSGVLHEELFFQSGQELLFTWTRIRPLMPGIRAAFANPNYLKNVETVAEGYIAFMNRANPGAYDSFAARVAARPAQTAKAS